METVSQYGFSCAHCSPSSRKGSKTKAGASEAPAIESPTASYVDEEEDETCPICCGDLDEPDKLSSTSAFALAVLTGTATASACAAARKPGLRLALRARRSFSATATAAATAAATATAASPSTYRRDSLLMVGRSTPLFGLRQVDWIDSQSTVST
jgi:hypothetical protein